jgi:hypothetical protein
VISPAALQIFFCFWQCVIDRMKPYEFYFLDPRLVTVEFQADENLRATDFPTIDSITSQKMTRINELL